MPDPRPGTALGRIAALETIAGNHEERITPLETRLAELEFRLKDLLRAGPGLAHGTAGDT